MTNLEYYLEHVIPTGFYTIGHAWKNWCDLMTGNHEPYKLRESDDGESECSAWFWTTLGEDNVYPKEFLEYLHQMANDVMTGKVKTIPWTEKDAEEFKQLMSIEDDE